MVENFATGGAASVVKMGTKRRVQTEALKKSAKSALGTTTTTAQSKNTMFMKNG